MKEGISEITDLSTPMYWGRRHGSKGSRGGGCAVI